VVRYLLLAFFLCVLESQCAADLFLDQSHVNQSTGMEWTINVQQGVRVEQAQTFTVGLTGRLSQFDVKINRADSTTNPLLVDIRTLSGGAPTEANSGSNILFQTSVSSALISQTTPGFQDLFRITIPQPIDVVAGTQLAIVLRTNQDSPPGSPSRGYRWFGPASSQITTPYTNGSVWTRVSTIGNWQSDSVLDVDFRTFVDVTAVPEPSSMILLLAGICMIHLKRLRKNSASITSPV
jgi:hypothetical protein